MAVVCIDIKGYTRADGTEVEAHKRCIDMNNVDGDTRVKISDFIQQIGRGTNDFDPVDTDREFRDLDRIIKNAIAKNEDKPLEVTDFGSWKNNIITSGLFGVQYEDIEDSQNPEEKLKLVESELEKVYDDLDKDEGNAELEQKRDLLQSKRFNLKNLIKGKVTSREDFVAVRNALNSLNDPYRKKNVGNSFNPYYSTVKKGEVINEYPDIGKVYKADVDGYLFRGVSLEDYRRIKEQGFIDTDQRGNISNREGTNLSNEPSFGYLPSTKEGVMMAIDVSDKDSLFMIESDDYVRTNEPIPFSDVKIVTTPSLDGWSTMARGSKTMKLRLVDPDDPIFDVDESQVLSQDTPISKPVDIQLTGSENMLADLLEGNFEGNEESIIKMIADEEGLRPSQVRRILSQSGYSEDPSKNPEFIKELDNLKQGYVANHKVEETPSFKAWSRGYDVVDGEVSSQFLKTGEPMVVTAYHGTKNNFEVFDAEGRSNSGGAFGSVNYFTTKYEDADHNYAENNDGASPLDRQQSRVEYDINRRLESLDFRDTATDIIEGLVDDYNLEDSDIDMDMLTEAIENHASYDASLMIVAATGAGGGKVLPLYLRLDNPLIIDYQNTKWWNESIPTLYPLDEDTIEELSNEYKETYGLEAGDDVPLMEVHHLNGTLEDDLNLWGAIDTALDKTIGDGASYNYAQKIRDKLAETSYWYEGEANPATLHDDLQKAAYEAGVDGHSVSTFASEVFYTMGYDALVLKNADKMWNGLLMPADTNHIHIPDRHKDHIKLANGLNLDFTESVNIRDAAGHKSFVDKIKGTKFEGMPLSKIMGTQEGKDFYNDYIREIKLNHLPRKRG